MKNCSPGSFFFYRRGCNSWRESFVFQTKQLNLDKDEV